MIGACNHSLGTIFEVFGGQIWRWRGTVNVSSSRIFIVLKGGTVGGRSTMLYMVRSM
jgi:hypothetical protein